MSSNPTLTALRDESTLTSMRYSPSPIRRLNFLNEFIFFLMVTVRSGQHEMTADSSIRHWSGDIAALRLAPGSRFAAQHSTSPSADRPTTARGRPHSAAAARAALPSRVSWLAHYGRSAAAHCTNLDLMAARDSRHGDSANPPRLNGGFSPLLRRLRSQLFSRVSGAWRKLSSPIYCDGRHVRRSTDAC